MPPCKFKKSRFFAFLASMFSPLSEPSSSTILPLVYPAIPPLRPRKWQIDVWRDLVFAKLSAWTGESQEVWSCLTRYRLDKAYHYKSTKGSKSHEYVICEFSVDQKNKIAVKFDRSASDSKEDSSITTFSSAETGTVNPEGPAASPNVSGRISSRSSSSFGKRFTSSLSLPSMRSLSRGSGVSSNECLADDTITRLERTGLPLSNSDTLLKTITFTGDRDERPHLWDLMALLLVVNKECSKYKLLENQCFWFADTSFYILEEWAKTRKCGTVDQQSKKGGRYACTSIYTRDLTKMEAVWKEFEDKRREMNQEREQFEQKKKDEDRRREEQMNTHVQEVTKQLKEEQEQREQQLNQQIADMARRLQHEQEERERQSKQLKEEQEERERQLNQEIADMARRLQHEQEERERQNQEKDRRFEELMRMHDVN